MTITQISVGVDGSHASVDALQWGAGLAANSSATVRAVMAWEMPLISGLPQMLTGQPSHPALAERCRAELVEAIRTAGLEGQVEAVLRHGGAGPILAAESIESDLLVLARTGRGLSRAAQLLLGSVARYCMYYAGGHVAVVPRGAQWHPNPTVIVGVDGSQNSIDALKWAITNLPTAAKISAVRAVPRTLSEIVTLDDKSSRLTIAAAETELQHNIKTAVAQVQTEPAPIGADVRGGRAADALLAPELEAHIVVVGEHGHTGMAATLLGSVADQVTRHASCPVVIVRADEES